MQVWHHLSHISWYIFLSVGCQLLEDSTAAISVLQLPSLYFLLLFYVSLGTYCADLKSALGILDHCFLNEVALAKDKNSRVSRKQALAILLIQPGKSTTWASWKRLIPNCAIMAKATFTAEQSRQLDILQAKEATFPSAGRVSFPCQDTSWSPSGSGKNECHIVK